MKVLMQKVNYATLSVDDKIVSQSGYGLLLTIGAHRDDTKEDAEKLAHKIVNYRVFKDNDNKINRSLLDIDGDIMVVSNFSLQAEILSGTRPNFSKCAEHTYADELYRYFADCFKSLGIKNVSLGSFGNHMHIHTELDGPFNLIFESGNNA